MKQLPIPLGSERRRPRVERREDVPFEKRLRRRMPDIEETHRTGDGERSVLRPLSGEQIITEVDDIVGEPVSRVIIRDPDATAEDFIELAARLGLHGTDYVVGWTAWMDLSPVGVSKASGLQHVCDAIGGLTAADVLAIGDGRNDIEMLRWAGRGVALGEAPAEVQDVADHVTSRFDQGGTAEELLRWF